MEVFNGSMCGFLEPQSPVKATLENVLYFAITKFLVLKMASLLAFDCLKSEALLELPVIS